jgi:hypothetical protein
VFTARYGLSPYIKQTVFVFKGLTALSLNFRYYSVGNKGPRIYASQTIFLKTFIITSKYLFQQLHNGKEITVL